jgi:hypothetical protein
LLAAPDRPLTPPSHKPRRGIDDRFFRGSFMSAIDAVDGSSTRHVSSTAWLMAKRLSVLPHCKMSLLARRVTYCDAAICLQFGAKRKSRGWRECVAFHTGHRAAQWEEGSCLTPYQLVGM